MIVTKDMIHARIGGNVELKPRLLHQRHLVRKKDWVDQGTILACISNLEDLPYKAISPRWWTWKDEDGDGHFLLVWKEGK